MKKIHFASKIGLFLKENGNRNLGCFMRRVIYLNLQLIRAEIGAKVVIN